MLQNNIKSLLEKILKYTNIFSKKLEYKSTIRFKKLFRPLNNKTVSIEDSNKLQYTIKAWFNTPSELLRAATIYTGVIILFAVFYWRVWKINPESFIIHQDLNHQSLVISYNISLKSKDISSKAYSKYSLAEIEDRINNAHNTISDFQKDYRDNQQKITRLERQIRSLYSQQETLRNNNFESYKKQQTESLDNDAESIKKELEAYLSYIYNPDSFQDSSITAKILSLEEQSKKADREAVELETKISSTENELKLLLKTKNDKKLEQLNLFDFLFYSIGISTTTTFGEMVANNKLVRSAVSLQLILSVFVLSSLIERTKSNKV